MIDVQQALGLSFAPLTVEIERGRLRAFARAIGEDNSIYTDADAARRAGYRDLPVPPTFFFSLALEADEPFGYLAALGVDLRSILHGEQLFTYHRMAYAGDELVLQDRITDVYDRRSGAMEFVVKESDIRRGDEHIATARSVIIVTHSEVLV